MPPKVTFGTQTPTYSGVINNMKTLKITLGIASIALFVAGCSLIGANPKPPTKFEEGVFDIKTNVVTEVRTVTNHVQVPVEVFHTNEVGVNVTNTIPQVVPQYITVTNHTEQYLYTPKQIVTDTATTAGTIGNIVAPGIGGIVTGILGGVIAMWGKLRSTKQVGTTLAQNIQTIREFLKTIPNGDKYDTLITQFMQKHQAEQGVLQQVVGILGEIDRSDAKVAAQELQASLTALNHPTK
jgi:hypothetical protein